MEYPPPKGDGLRSVSLPLSTGPRMSFFGSGFRRRVPGLAARIATPLAIEGYTVSKDTYLAKIRPGPFP